MLTREHVAELLGYRTPAKFSAQRARLRFPEPDFHFTTGGRPRAYWRVSTVTAWLDRRAAALWRRRWRPAITSALPEGKAAASCGTKEARDG